MILKALMHGQSLQNPKFWKRLQMLITLLAGLLPFFATLIPALQPIIDKDLLSKLMGSVLALNLYFIPATSEKIGL